MLMIVLANALLRGSSIDWTISLSILMMSSGSRCTEASELRPVP